MLKFKGKPHEVIAFINRLVDIYGGEITLKELIEKLKGESKNVSL
jgi:hypothetical protein